MLTEIHWALSWSSITLTATDQKQLNQTNFQWQKKQNEGTIRKHMCTRNKVT